MNNFILTSLVFSLFLPTYSFGEIDDTLLLEDLLLSDYQDELLSPYLSKSSPSTQQITLEELLLDDHDQYSFSFYFQDVENEIALPPPPVKKNNALIIHASSRIEENLTVIEEEPPTYFYDPTPSPFISTHTTKLFHTEGKLFGNSRGYTSATAFIEHTTRHRNALPFIQANLHVFNDQGTASNIGIGSRLFLGQSTKQIGVNGFFDFQHHAQDYSQLGIGFEYLGPNFNFSVNGYQPVGRKSKYYHHTTCVYEGTPYIIRFKSLKKAFSGCDATLRARLLSSKGGQFDINGGMGSYLYHRGNGSNIVGGRLGMDIWYSGIVRAEVFANYDHYYKVGIQSVIAIEMPLYGGNRNLRDYRTQPIYRQNLVALSHRRCHFKANWPYKDYCH